MTTHDHVLQQMNAMAERFKTLNIPLSMPPASVKTLGTEYTQIKDGEMLAAKIPFRINLPIL